MSHIRRLMTAFSLRLALVAILSFVVLPVWAQWVEFRDETATRLVADSDVGVGDIEEKDYAWGDVDRDGDIDLVVVRKQPFTSVGKQANVLFLNEDGVLVDRTDDFVTTSTIPGDEGFNTLTNDRDVVLVDVDGDSWLDIVTATTISDGDPKHIGHPRIYMNLRLFQGAWQGFRHDDARIPTMPSYSGQTEFNPRFCSVTAGDLTGDGRPELYFGDYDNGDGPPMPEGADYNDRLLVNSGSGSFSDLTQSRLLGLLSIPASDSERFEVSRFGAADVIADMNGDGFNDIVKQTSLQSPIFVAVAYNDPFNEGFFDDYEVVSTGSPYFVSVGDLNNDEQMDIVITDDGADRYLLNQGNGADGRADFISFGFQFEGASDDGFGSNSLISDLDNDGWNDVLIADVDVDTSGCGRRMHIYRNQGGVPGDDVILKEETQGTDCHGGSATCSVAGIPNNMLVGVHDVAVFDIDGDGLDDMVLGRCSGTEVWINVPPSGIALTPQGELPAFVDPDEVFEIRLHISAFGGATIQPGTEELVVAIGESRFQLFPLTSQGAGDYLAQLPAAACGQVIRYYFRAETPEGEVFVDPPGAPTPTYEALAAFGTATTFEDRFESDVSGWTVVSDPSLTGGEWEVADPVGTLSPTGEEAAPFEDGEDGSGNVKAFVTEDGSGGGAGVWDVDWGPTHLISPPLDLAGEDAVISYQRWMYSNSFDSLLVEVTNDGTNWVTVEVVDGSQNQWNTFSFQVGRFVTPTATVQVRFSVEDTPNNSLVEAGVDHFRVAELICSTCMLQEECDDGLFCNGAERCVEGLCLPGSEVCSTQQCDEVADACVACLVDGDCDNGSFCDGPEACVDNVCVAGADPCPGEPCDDVVDDCVNCAVDADCSNGIFCDGEELCIANICGEGLEPCPGQTCDELVGQCVGSITLQPKPGQPLSGLSQAERERFDKGRVAFDTVLSQAEGLGPVFNENSCGSCHNTPLGGSGTVTVTRFGFVDEKKGGFDPLADLGGSLLQSEAISAECAEAVPASANVTASRLTNSALGFGLVEAIPDVTLEANAISPPPGVTGRVHTVEMLEQPGTPRVGRFGWKSQVATVLTFSGDAGLNEMGLTNRLVGEENAPNGDPVLLAQCDTVADPEDGPDREGFDFIDRVTDFQRFLAPPPQTPRSGMTGETIFETIQCVYCHLSGFPAATDAASVPLPTGSVLEDAIRGRYVKAYSDFLLHDMGASADFIEQGDATGFELRTPPLWGLRLRDPMWHDGRALGGTFGDRIREVIDEHDAVGSEARFSAQQFLALSTPDQEALIAFLDSLGRCEFDLDGDGDVDDADYQEFLACFTGPGSFYDPDDPCSVADPDQDGDVDDDDLDLFLVAVDGEAGEVPNGADVPGPPLTIEPVAGGDLALSWSPSCLGSDDDYGVYEGTLGDFSSHGSVTCSTAGATGLTLTPAGGSTYYLVVPRNGFREGSYGIDSDDNQRPQGAGACVPQSPGSCL